MFDFNFSAATEAQTASFGQRLAHLAHKGDCFALFGTLGMGKSVLARAFIQSLCGEVDVPSPTFTLVQLYDAPDFCIYHFDLYRLKSAEEIFELGMEEALYDGVSLIEWPDKMGGYLPKNCARITITPQGSGRNINIQTSSPSLAERLSKEFCQ